MNTGIHLARNLTNFDSNVKGKRTPSFSRSTLNNHTEVGPATESVIFMCQYQIASSKSAFGALWNSGCLWPSTLIKGLELLLSWCANYDGTVEFEIEVEQKRDNVSGVAPEVDNRFSFSPFDSESALTSSTISSC